MDLNLLIKDLEEIKLCIENDYIEKAEDLLVLVIGEITITANAKKNVLRACVSVDCGWVGKESACLTWKHAGSERICPHCHDSTEAITISAFLSEA